jgi:hypothetical protein
VYSGQNALLSQHRLADAFGVPQDTVAQKKPDISGPGQSTVMCYKHERMATRRKSKQKLCDLVRPPRIEIIRWFIGEN